MIFRDSLRVLPYGRVDNDFFQIEERRSWNAGRYYWSNRRIFGYIGITQSSNKELKDKSGREGFIRNQAARELKTIISNLLTETVLITPMFLRPLRRILRALSTCVLIFSNSELILTLTQSIATGLK